MKKLNYCSSSYKILASYKRNKYNPGHYIVEPSAKKVQETGLSLPVDLEKTLSILNDKIENLSIHGSNESINTRSVTNTNAAIGADSANALTYGVQKILAPQTLPATKKDIEELKNEFNNLKKMLVNLNLKKAKPDISLSNMF